LDGTRWRRIVYGEIISRQLHGDDRGDDGNHYGSNRRHLLQLHRGRQCLTHSFGRIYPIVPCTPFLNLNPSLFPNPHGRKSTSSFILDCASVLRSAYSFLPGYGLARGHHRNIRHHVGNHHGPHQWHLLHIHRGGNKFARPLFTLLPINPCGAGNRAWNPHVFDSNRTINSGLSLLDCADFFRRPPHPLLSHSVGRRIHFSDGDIGNHHGPHQWYFLHIYRCRYQLGWILSTILHHDYTLWSL
jgi:hypothetical protein